MKLGIPHTVRRTPVPRSGFNRFLSGARCLAAAGLAGTLVLAGCSGGAAATARSSVAGRLSGASHGNHALTQWFSALNGRSGRPATWVSWGDSLAEGQGSTTVAGRWVNRALRDLRAAYPVSGVAGGFGYVPAFYGTYDESQWSTDPVISGNASQDLNGSQLGDGPGLGLRTVTLSPGGSEAFTMTGTSADILFDHGSGSFSYTVDSGGATTVSASGAGGAGAAGSRHVAFSSGGSHTVTVSGASGHVILEGVMEYNGDESKGIRLYDGAQCSLTTSDFMRQAGNLSAITASVNPDLVTIELGGNDFEAGIPAATVASNLKAMVRDIRSAATAHEPSIVIVLVYPTPGSTWPRYSSAIRGVTTSDASIGLLDLTSFATTGSTNGGLLTPDGVHPSDAGQAKLATLVAHYLEGR